MYFFVYGNINLSRSSPKHNYACAAVGFLEVADILLKFLNHVPAGLAVLNVVTVKTLCIVVVESSLHGLDLLELVLYGEDVLLLENFGVHSRFKCVGGIYVPSSEHDVVEVGDGNNLVVFEVFLVGTFSNTHYIILCH